MKIYGQIEKASFERLGADPTGTGLVAGRVWYRTDLTLLKIYDGSVSRQMVDTSLAQTLTNKTLTAPVLGGPIVSDYTEFTHVATPATPAAGKSRVYFDAAGTPYYLNPDGSPRQFGSGGAGDLDTYNSETFDNLSDLSGWLTGDSATPVTGGGTLTGTFVIDDVTPLSGLKSLSYTQDASSLNAWFADQVIDVPLTARGKENGIKFDMLNNANDDEIEFFVYDVTNAAFLEVNGYQLENAETTTVNKVVTFFVPQDCEQIRYGFHVVTLNSGKILQIDNIVATSSPFVTLNMGEAHSLIRLRGGATATGRGSAVNNVIHCFTTLDQSLGDAITYTASTVNGDTFAVNRSGFYAITFQGISNPVVIIGISKNAASLTTGIRSTTGANRLAFARPAADASVGTVSWSGYLVEGDVIRAHVDSTTYTNAGNGDQVQFSIAHFGVDDPMIITPARVNLTNWESFTPTFQSDTTIGFTINKARKKRVGSDLLIDFTITATGNGTSGGQLAFVIPDGLLTDAHGGANTWINSLGNWFDNSVASHKNLTFNMVDNNTFRFGTVPGGGISGNQIGTGDVLSGMIRIPIADWQDSQVTYLAAIPQIDIIKGNNSTLANWSTIAAHTTYGDITSIALGEGIWELDALLVAVNNGAITTSYIEFFWGTASGTSATGAVEGLNYILRRPINTLNSQRNDIRLPSYIVTVTTPTIFYLKGRAVTDITNLQYMYSYTAKKLRGL